jgi:hypothetical protein
VQGQADLADLVRGLPHADLAHTELGCLRSLRRRCCGQHAQDLRNAAVCVKELTGKVMPGEIN